MTAAGNRRDSTPASPLDALRERILARAAMRLAHDFNNDLTVIGGHLELARRGPEDLGARLDAMRNAGERARARVRLVQDLGRARPGTEGPEVHRLAPDLDAVCQLLCGREIVFEISAAGPASHGAVDRDGQRLLTAAIIMEALDAGIDRLEIELEPLGDLLHVRVRARDGAEGDPALATRLASVAAACGIELEQRDDRGDRLLAWTLRTGARQVGTTTGPATATASDGPVMVVDDDPTVRRIFVEALRRTGVEVVEASSGTEALALVESGPVPGLLVTDAQLHGGMDGPALARRMREQHPHIGVIVVSGYASPEGNGQSEFTWLQKPIPLKSFTQHVLALREADAPHEAA
ncbi:MAG: response regulator [Pseudomonadales bacterium]|jgi:CheY-like chemotaxis protein|nr:response regulator [Pseudomonadales bacterium]